MFYSRNFHSAGVAVSADRGWRLRVMFIHALCTVEVIDLEGRKGANGVWGGIGDGIGVENGDVNGDGDGDRARTRTGVEASEQTQDGAGTGRGTGVETRGRTHDGNADGAGTETRAVRETRTGNGDWIGKGVGEAKKWNKLHKSCRCDVENEGDLGGKRKNVDKKVLVQ